MAAKDDKLAILESTAKELHEDLDKRIETIERMIRDVGLGIDHLEKVQALALRSDRLKLREKGREIGEQLLQKLSGDKPDQSAVLHLRFIQTLLLSNIDITKDSRILDSLVKAVEKIGGEPPKPDTPVEEQTF